MPPFPNNFFAGLVIWLLNECHCFLSTLVRYRIPPETFEARSWARMTLYHLVAWLLFDVPLTGLLFLCMRLADAVSYLPRFRMETPRFGAGRPFWAWTTLHPLAAWWLETLLLGGLLAWAFSAEGRSNFHAFFGHSNFLLYVLAIGLVWRCIVERLGAVTVAQARR